MAFFFLESGEIEPFLEGIKVVKYVGEKEV
jgi:hypothetical protein